MSTLTRVAVVRDHQEQVTAAVSWLMSEISRCCYGEIGIRFVMHGGKISRVERMIIQKSIPGDEDGDK